MRLITLSQVLATMGRPDALKAAEAGVHSGAPMGAHPPEETLSRQGERRLFGKGESAGRNNQGQRDKPLASSARVRAWINARSRPSVSRTDRLLSGKPHRLAGEFNPGHSLIVTAQVRWGAPIWRDRFFWTAESVCDSRIG